MPKAVSHTGSLIVGWLLLLSWIPTAGAAKTELCSGPVESVTEPAPVKLPELISALETLQLASGERALAFTLETKGVTEEIFDEARVKTKMEQFYRLLDVIQKTIPRERGDVVTLEAEGVRNVLLISAVFRDPAIPSQITGVSLDRGSRHRPRYTVTFADEKTSVPLNQGDGFFVFQSGKCQQSKSLIFGREFSFELRNMKNGNLKVQDFSGVDLYGDFGSRGWFDVDVEFVSVRSVEFYKGSKLGEIRAYVSRKEFQKNDHNPLLRVITKFVGDTSVQPIDW